MAFIDAAVTSNQVVIRIVGIDPDFMVIDVLGFFTEPAQRRDPQARDVDRPLALGEYHQRAQAAQRLRIFGGLGDRRDEPRARLLHDDRHHRVLGGAADSALGRDGGWSSHEGSRGAAHAADHADPVLAADRQTRAATLLCRRHRGLRHGGAAMVSRRVASRHPD